VAFGAAACLHQNALRRLPSGAGGGEEIGALLQRLQAG
jgi:hypothetical protein